MTYRQGLISSFIFFFFLQIYPCIAQENYNTIHLQQSISKENMSPLDLDILKEAKQATQQCVEAFESAIQQNILSEESLYCELYFPLIPYYADEHLKLPPTFGTFFDDYTDNVIRPIEDATLLKNKRIIFVVLVDQNGYLPSHNSKYSHEPTGDLEKDLKLNRSKRIFTDRTGYLAAQNTQELLLQTYQRDTGELMADLSVPVRISGKHWGAIRIGYLRGEKHV